jgi:hypothetical protein
LEANVLFLLKEVENLNPKAVEGFLLGYDSNTRAYRVFNKSTGLVEVSCDIVFDETNGSQVEQVDLDELDDEEALCVLRDPKSPLKHKINRPLGMCVLRNPKSPLKHKINRHLPTMHLHQLKMRIRLKTMKMNIKRMSHLTKRTRIKGETELIKTRKMIKKFRVKDHHTQESTKQSNEITRQLHLW